MDKYHKIYAPWTRATSGPNRNELIPGEWTMPELGYLADLRWHWTEKVDGTNIRVGWDGHTVEYGGRTDNAQIPAKLVGWLKDCLNEGIFESVFQGVAVTLYGEGFGAGIQSGGNYSADQTFVLFDVKIGDVFLRFDDMCDVAGKLGINYVPEIGTMTLNEAIRFVQHGGPNSAWGRFRAEGIVGTPVPGMLTRMGERIIVKLKSEDLYRPAPERVD